MPPPPLLPSKTLTTARGTSCEERERTRTKRNLRTCKKKKRKNEKTSAPSFLSLFPSSFFFLLSSSFFFFLQLLNTKNASVRGRPARAGARRRCSRGGGPFVVLGRGRGADRRGAHRSQGWFDFLAAIDRSMALRTILSFFFLEPISSPSSPSLSSSTQPHAQFVEPLPPVVGRNATVIVEVFNAGSR